MLIESASRAVRHTVAAGVTVAGIAVVWFVLWTLFCLLVLVVGDVSFKTYIAGVFLVFIGLLPALLIVVPSVLLAERITGNLSIARYVVQAPIVLGLTFVGALTLLISGALVGWLAVPGLLGYVGISVVMALPVAGVYWLTAKTIEFGIESVLDLINMVLSGLGGVIDLYRYVRFGDVVFKAAPAPQPQAIPDPSPGTTHTTPSLAPEARGR